MAEDRELVGYQIECWYEAARRHANNPEFTPPHIVPFIVFLKEEIMIEMGEGGLKESLITKIFDKEIEKQHGPRENWVEKPALEKYKEALLMIFELSTHRPIKKIDMDQSLPGLEKF